MAVPGDSPKNLPNPAHKAGDAEALEQEQELDAIFPAEEEEGEGAAENDAEAALSPGIYAMEDASPPPGPHAVPAATPAAMVGAANISDDDAMWDLVAGTAVSPTPSRTSPGVGQPSPVPRVPGSPQPLAAAPPPLSATVRIPTPVRPLSAASNHGAFSTPTGGSPRLGSPAPSIEAAPGPSVTFSIDAPADTDTANLRNFIDALVCEIYHKKPWYQALSKSTPAFFTLPAHATAAAGSHAIILSHVKKSWFSQTQANYQLQSKKEGNTQTFVVTACAGTPTVIDGVDQLKVTALALGMAYLYKNPGQVLTFHLSQAEATDMYNAMKYYCEHFVEKVHPACPNKTIRFLLENPGAAPQEMIFISRNGQFPEFQPAVSPRVPDMGSAVDNRQRSSPSGSGLQQSPVPLGTASNPHEADLDNESRLSF